VITNLCLEFSTANSSVGNVQTDGYSFLLLPSLSSVDNNNAAMVMLPNSTMSANVSVATLSPRSHRADDDNRDDDDRQSDS
jgi:hypothetical protein